MSFHHNCYACIMVVQYMMWICINLIMIKKTLKFNLKKDKKQILCTLWKESLNSVIEVMVFNTTCSVIENI